MTLNRRKFMQTLGLLTVTIPNIGIGKEQNKISNISAETPGFTIAPYIQNLTTNSISIQILTNTNSYTWVEYGIEGFDHKFFASLHGLKVANCRYFNFHLTNLVPGTTYKYRVHTKNIVKLAGYEVIYGDEIRTQEYKFTTPPLQKDSCEVIIYNDIHDRKESFKHLWNLKQQQNTDLVFFNGDIFNQVSTEQQVVNNFLKPINDLFSTQIPMVFNRGNHETRGGFAREIINYFDYPNQLTYQAFELGPVFWICLDSGEDKTDASKEYFGLADFDTLRLEQRDWLQKIVKTKAFKKAKYRAVVMHMPPLHSGDWHGPTHCTELFVPIFNANKINIVYSGHTHKAIFHPPTDKNKFALLIGGAPQDGKRTIIDIKADQKTFTSKLIDDNGNLLHEYTIKP